MFSQKRPYAENVSAFLPVMWANHGNMRAVNSISTAALGPASLYDRGTAHSLSCLHCIHPNDFSHNPANCFEAPSLQTSRLRVPFCSSSCGREHLTAQTQLPSSALADIFAQWKVTSTHSCHMCLSALSQEQTAEHLMSALSQDQPAEHLHYYVCRPPYVERADFDFVSELRLLGSCGREYEMTAQMLVYQNTHQRPACLCCGYHMCISKQFSPYIKRKFPLDIAKVIKSYLPPCCHRCVIGAV